MAMIPRSMPPPAPPPRQRPAEEVEKLTRYQAELDAMAHERRLQHALHEKHHGWRKAQVAQRRSYERLYVLLKGKTLRHVALQIDADPMHVWRVLHGAYEAGELKVKTLLKLAAVMDCTAKDLFSYLTWAHGQWKRDHP